MKRDNEFNTCLHFDLSDSLHRKAVEILENYNKKKYHSYTNFIATALTEYTEHRDDDIFIEKITEALTPKITEIVRREIGGYEGKIVAKERTVSQKSENIRTNDIDEKVKNENSILKLNVYAYGKGRGHQHGMRYIYSPRLVHALRQAYRRNHHRILK